MPDPNKFAKLGQIHYAVAPCCWVCRHSEFKVPWWGYCGLHRYEHAKHKNPGEGRKLGVHALGRCDDCDIDYGKTGVLESYAKFLEAAP